MSNSPAPMLEYESSGSEPTTLEIVDTLDGGVTITVPTRRTVWRFISSMMSADLLAVIFSPFAWVVFRLLATRKPRAVLRMTSTEFAVLQTSDKGLGIVETKQFWPLTEIGELRPNRFEYGSFQHSGIRSLEFT